MTKRSPSIADLIAQTPGAQTREDAHASIKARREQWLSTSSLLLPDPAAAEPMPAIDTDAYARDFFSRLMDQEPPTAPPRPPRGHKPRLVSKDDPPTT